MAWTVIVVLLTVSLPSAAGVLSLPVRGGLDLAEALHYLEDPNGTLDITTLRETARPLQQHEGGEFNRGFSSATWWLRVRIANPHAEPLERLLWLSYPKLEQVEIFAFVGDEQRAHYRLGRDRPYPERVINHHDYIVPLAWEAEETLDIYIRVASRNILRAPLAVWDRTSLMSRLNSTYLIDGLLLGALLGLATYNLLLFLVTRERNYLYYVGMTLCILLMIAILRGLAFRFLWPHLPAWNSRSLLVFLNATLVFTALFAQRFMRIDTISPNWTRILKAILAFAAFALVASVVLPYGIAIRLAIVNAVVAAPLFLICSLDCWIRGVPAARYATAAAATMLTIVPLFAAEMSGWVSLPPGATRGLHIGVASVALMLSFGLAARINHDRRLRLEAQTQALRATEAANIELQKRVTARTREQEALAEQLRALSVTDALTELGNRRHFEQQLALRWSLTGTRLAVILIDIDHFKFVNDTYGHAAGDTCLREVARRISENVYFPKDDAARYGGEEFALCLPDTDEHGAWIVAERIRQAVAQRPVYVSEHAIALTVSAGVAAGVSEANIPPDELMLAADRALYAAKRAGRNRVMTTSETAEPVS